MRQSPRPPRRLTRVSINRLLPNMLTTLALCAGMTALRFAVQQRWEAAVLAIVVAAILDALDGKTARLLHGETKFGEELDSLSDVVCFGVAPAITLYLWALRDAGTVGWLAALSLCVGAALRLARFNSKLGDIDVNPRARDYFSGVPAPGGAGLSLLPMSLEFGTDLHIAGFPYFVAVWTAATALLMVSTVPTFSIKRIRVPHRWLVPVLAAVGMVAAAIASAPWTVLTGIGLAYIATLPFSLNQYGKLPRAGAEMPPKPEAQPDAWPRLVPARAARIEARRAGQTAATVSLLDSTDDDPQQSP